MMRNRRRAGGLIFSLAALCFLFSSPSWGDDGYTESSEPQDSEEGTRLSGDFTHKTVEKGWGWQYTCAAETKYEVSYEATLDESTFHIEFLDNNVMDITVWIRDIPLNLYLYHRGKKTACKWVNPAVLIAPKERKLKAHIDDIYLHVRVTPMSVEDEEGNETEKYHVLPLENTTFYNFQWTNFAVTKLPNWLYALLNDSVETELKKVLRDYLASPAVWELSDKISEAMAKHLMSEE